MKTEALALLSEKDGVAISIPAAEARKRERGNLGKVESGDGIMGKQEDEKIEQQDGGKAETW